MLVLVCWYWCRSVSTGDGVLVPECWCAGVLVCWCRCSYAVLVGAGAGSGRPHHREAVQ